MFLKDLHLNESNPRQIKGEKFEKLKKSIKEFERMLELRPIIIDDDNVILGGNMRYRALEALGYTEIPDAWVKRASGLTDEQKREFLIKDNIGYGEWDFDVLFNEWDTEKLTDWGMDLPIQGSEIDIDNLFKEASGNKKNELNKITIEVPENIDKEQIKDLVKSVLLDYPDIKIN